jgi:hypothetical protein
VGTVVLAGNPENVWQVTGPDEADPR